MTDCDTFDKSRGCDTRATVAMVVGQLAGGRTIDDVLADYPYLEREDVLAALEYAASP